MLKRFSIFLVVLSFFVLFVGACAPKQLTYVYDFVDKQSLGSGENLWTASQPSTVYFGANGVSISRSNLSSPYEYKGNFVIEVEVFIEALVADESEDIVFELRDAISGNGAQFLMERPGPDSTYSLIRFNPWIRTVDDALLTPYLDPGAVNTVRIAKTPGKVEFWLNDEPLGAVNEVIDSASIYWLLTFNAYDGWNEGLVYHGIRKVTIKYGPENQRPYVPDVE